MYKICVVGAGKWGLNHIRTLSKLNLLGCVVEVNEKAKNYIKKKYPNIKVSSSVDKAIKQNYDGFIVATNPTSHYSIAKAIIEKGFHVLVEKPLTLNKADAISLCNIAKKNNVNLMVGHLLLFHPAFIKIKQILDSGRIGVLQYIYSNRLNLGTVRTDENVFWSFAPHDISLFQYFFNDQPVEVISRGIDVIQDNIHDTTITSIKYPNKVMGHIFVSWLHPFKEHRFVVVGSKGMIHFEDSHTDKPLLLFDKSIKFDGDSISTPEVGITEEIEYDKELPLDLELKYFIDHLDGKRLDIASGESAIEVIDILEKATASLSEKKVG